jgi:hypothetical protein
MENTFFKNTAKDIASISPILQKVVDFALQLGVKPDGVNLINAWGRCEKVIREKIEADSKAQELGYKSLALALKALGQYKDRSNVDISHMPEVFHKPAVIWLTGKPKTKTDKGFAPLRARDAELEHMRLLPWLLKAWQMTENNENGEQIRDELVILYGTSTPDEFTNKCYILINEMDEPTLEYEFDRRVEKASSVFERAQSLRAISERNYGVGGALEEVSWDDD